MEKIKPNHAKKMAKLRYKDEILTLRKDGKSLAEITKLINYKLVRTHLHTTLSQSSISNIIKEYQK